MGADFTPNMNGYTGQGAFRFWCQKVLPLVYDDSLSYYELLCKVVNYLNNVISDVASVETNVQNLYNSFVNLQDYVNDYFDNLDLTDAVHNNVSEVFNEYSETNEFKALVDGYVNDYLSEYAEQLIDESVGLKIDNSVAGQIDDVVAEQLPNAIGEDVSELTPSIVTQWLNDNVTPVGSAVVVDSSLSITGAAADAKVTGDNLTIVKNVIDLVESEQVTVSQFEQGSLNPSTGTSGTSNNYVRSPSYGVNLEKYKGARTLTNNVVFDMMCYDANGNYLGVWSDNGFSTTAQNLTSAYFSNAVTAGAAKIRLRVKYAETAEITPSDAADDVVWLVEPYSTKTKEITGNYALINKLTKLVAYDYTFVSTVNQPIEANYQKSTGGKVELANSARYSYPLPICKKNSLFYCDENYEFIINIYNRDSDVGSGYILASYSGNSYTPVTTAIDGYVRVAVHYLGDSTLDTTDPAVIAELMSHVHCFIIYGKAETNTEYDDKNRGLINAQKAIANDWCIGYVNVKNSLALSVSHVIPYYKSRTGARLYYL